MPQAASWAGTPSIKGGDEWLRMALLTFSLIGLQFTWGIEMTYCTPYLLQLGLTKSRTSLVWIAGPLSGLIMQPVVGVIADRSKSKWGRRRPFMVGGSLLVGICLMILGWTAEIVGMFVSNEETKKSATIALAVLSIYAVDFAINAVQSCCRSLIVDTLPIPKQQAGSAWASRMIAVGHLVGYVAGTVNLLSIFGTTFGNTQFKQLCFISAAVLNITVGVTSYSVQERVLISGRDPDAQTGAIHLVAQIIKTTWYLPPRIQAICWVQFWSWIGWFPFLFYSTTWVGETYFRYSPSAPDSSKSSDALGDIGRVGSLSLVIFSFISLLGSIALPLLILSPEEEAKPPSRRIQPHQTSNIFDKMRKPDLLSAWTVSHFIFSGSMFLAPFVRSLGFATVLVAVCGIPWALTCWAPFAFIGVEINRLSHPSGYHHAIPNGHSGGGGGGGYHRLSDAAPVSPTDDDVNPSFELGSQMSAPHQQQQQDQALHLHHHHHSDSIDSITHVPMASRSASALTTASTGELAGIYLGILNLFTTLPQFVGTFISMIVFSILEPGKSPELTDDKDQHHSTEGVNAIAVCLFIGACSTIVAAEATRRLRFVS